MCKYSEGRVGELRGRQCASIVREEEGEWVSGGVTCTPFTDPLTLLPPLTPTHPHSPCMLLPHYTRTLSPPSLTHLLHYAHTLYVMDLLHMAKHPGTIHYIPYIEKFHGTNFL